MLVDFMTRIFAPTQLNPLNITRCAVWTISWTSRAARPPRHQAIRHRLNVRTCKSVSSTAELTADTLLLGLHAAHLQGDRDRWRGVLGWRLSQQPGDLPLINECAARRW
jgi:hypothetical protein